MDCKVKLKTNCDIAGVKYMVGDVVTVTEQEMEMVKMLGAGDEFVEVVEAKKK